MHPASFSLSQLQKKITSEVTVQYLNIYSYFKQSDLPGHEFTRVGNSLIRYGREELFYLSARRRCMETFEANLVEFRNEQEWGEVISRDVHLCAYYEICFRSLNI